MFSDPQDRLLEHNCCALDLSWMAYQKIQNKTKTHASKTGMVLGSYLPIGKSADKTDSIQACNSL